MTDTLNDLARKLMDLPDFRWREGMVDVNGSRVVGIGRNGLVFCGSSGMPFYSDLREEAALDLTEPATKGCIEAWCEERFGASFYCDPIPNCDAGFSWVSKRWLAGSRIFVSRKERPTKIEAMAAALLGER